MSRDPVRAQAPLVPPPAPPALPAGTAVSGGAGGIWARWTDLQILAVAFRTHATTLNDWAVEDQDVLDGVAMRAGQMLAWGSHREAEAALRDACWALTRSALALGAVAHDCEGARDDLRAADEGIGALADGALRALGELGGFTLPVAGVAPFIAAAGTGMVGARMGVGAGPFGPLSEAVARGFTANPLASRALGSVQGRADAAGPADFGDLDSVGGMVAAVSAVPDDSGAFGVRTVTAADGTRSYTVILPGLQATDLGPRGLASAVNTHGGRDSTYANAVRDALGDLGIKPGDTVVIVGHSLGGMTAAALARDPRFKGKVVGVVTAGSPVEGRIPRDVPSVSVRNRHDPVWQIQGNSAGDDRRHVTVTQQKSQQTNDHSLDDVYTPFSRTVDDIEQVRDVKGEWARSGHRFSPTPSSGTVVDRTFIARAE